MSQIQDAYNRWALTYDKDLNLTRDLDSQVTRKAIGQRPWGAILELGCGTGKNTMLLAEVGQTVQALDFSTGMLHRAREKVTAENVQFTQADLTRRWPIATQTIDLIVCNLVLEHIERLNIVFAEAARTLVANGRFFISELHPFRQYQGKQAVFEKDGIQTKIPAFVHHLSDFWRAGTESGLHLLMFDEWWHEQDEKKPPRLVTLMFEKRN